MATQELVTQLNPEHYDNLTDANAIGRTNFGISSCQNNTGTVFAIGSDDNVTVYTSNSYSTKYATSISNPGNSNSLFGFKIAMDSPGDTIIVGAPGDNRAYVFDAQNQARTSWSQRSSGWNGNSYLGTSNSGTIHYGADVDVAADDDSLFVIGRPGDHKIELWSWPNGSSATFLTTITHSDNFGFSCKLSADGQVVIAGGPGNYYPSQSNAYGNGIAEVYAKNPSNPNIWTRRTLPFDYTDCPTYVEYTDDEKLTTIKSVSNVFIESGGIKTPVKPAFGFSVAINKDGTYIAVSAPNRKCFFAAEWTNNTYYKWLTGKPITGEKDAFGSFLFMQYDGTRIVTGNTSIELKYYWGDNFQRWMPSFYYPKSYCVLDWNGIYYTNYSESFNLYSLGGLPTSMSKNGEFCLFSMKFHYDQFEANEARETGSNRTAYTGSTVFSFTRFAPTIKILGTTTVGGDLKVRFLSIGGDKSYIESDSNSGFVPGYINFENTKDEHSIFRSQIINTSQYTGDDNLSELLLFKSGHVRGLNSRGPDRIRLKSPSVILEGITCENHPVFTTFEEVGVTAELWSKFLKEASAVYSRLTLTGIGNVGIGVPEYADHIIKENWNLGSTSVVDSPVFHKQNANANAQAPPLINHRLVIDGTQSIQNGKLYINNPISSNLTIDGMSACYNTMTSDCIKNTNTTNIPYVICDIKKRNPYYNRDDGNIYYEDRMRLYNTVTYDDVNKGLYFGTSTSYAQGFIHEGRDTFTGNTTFLVGVYTVSYWFMLKDYAQSTFGTSGQLVFTAYRDTVFGYGHKITSSGFKIQYSPSYYNVEADYTVNYTFSQNVWYHVCVKVDNTTGNGATEGTATTQLWINGVSQSLTANETVRNMQGMFPRFCYFGVVNQAVNQSGYGEITGNHTLGGDGMYGHLISNIKIYIASDGSHERIATPDYNSASDFYNEGPPNEGISLSGGMNISGQLRVNGNTGTSGQVLTSSGSGGAPTWTTSWSTLNSNVYYTSGNVGIGTSTPLYNLHVVGTSNFTDAMYLSGSAGTSGQVLTSSGSGAPTWTTVSGGSSVWSTGTNSAAYYNLGYVGIGTTSPAYNLDVAGDINFTGTLYQNGSAFSGGGSSPWTTSGSDIYYNSGNVGIGTTTPTSKLYVSGDGYFTSSVNASSFSGDGSGITSLNSSNVTSGTLAVSYGGTGQSTYATGDLIYASGTNTLSKLSPGTSGQVLTSSGTGSVPTWTTVPWSTLNSNVYYNSGKVGIGTSTPDSLLTLNSSSNHTVTIDSGTYTSFLHMNRTNGNWYATTDNTDTWNQNLYWLANTSDTGNPLKRILRFENDTASAGSNAIGTFTGQHMSSIIDVRPNNINDYVGLIVSSNQNDYMTVSGVPLRGAKNIHVNEAIPIVKITSKAYDKSCFGVLSSSEDTNERSQVMGQIRSYFYKEDGDTRVYVNSIGEGGIWIVNENGVLESGDYITTSNVSGYGMKQDSEFLANYTVAKITMDCDFNPKQVPVKQIKKINKLVTYYVHNSDNTIISENEYIKLDNVQKQEYTQETKTETVNDLDSNGEFQWEDTLETELEYNIRYLDINGIETTQENSVYTAAFVGCTYHCG